MGAFISGLDTVIGLARSLLLGGVLFLSGLCAVEWAARTNRLNPFSAFARGARRLLNPLVTPMERRVVRAGGLPASAPWWTLGAAVVAGIVTLTLLDFLRAQLVGVAYAMDAGGRGMLRLAAHWAFGILYLAIILRVFSSWFRVNPFAWWLRWSYTVTEPLLRPIRRVVPIIAGTIDISPLVAWVLLSWVLEPLILRLVL